VLYTADGKAHQINPSAIKALVIEDTLTNFYQTGHIIIDNSFDVIERPYSDTEQISPFLFMGDSRDSISIEIMPLNNADGTGTIDDNAKKRLLINLQASIYDAEEITTDVPDVKYRKLYFWDKYYEYLREKNVYWSTADVVDTEVNPGTTPVQTGAVNPLTLPSINPLPLVAMPTATGFNANYLKKVSNFNNDSRGISTGKAIKKFLAAALPENDKYPAFFPGTNYGSDWKDTTTDSNIISDDQFWDEGSTNIFFSTPAKYKAIDCIKYLLSRHVSSIDSGYDQAILRIDRVSRCFTLTPLSQLFQQAYDYSKDAAGILYCETIKLGALVQGDSSTGEIGYAPKNNALELVQSGTVKNFALEPAIGRITQTGINTKIIHSYDYADKSFQIDNVNNNIKSTVSLFYRNYVDTVKSGSYVSIVPGQYRVSNKNVEHKFSVIENTPGTNTSNPQRLSQGRNTALFDALFANNQASFTVPGITLRQSGMFVGIDRVGASMLSTFDQKFLGIYLMTEVKHMFEGNTYTNEIKCIKTYTDYQIYAGQISNNEADISNQTTV
jgi:hypothetical protein